MYEIGKVIQGLKDPVIIVLERDDAVSVSKRLEKDGWSPKYSGIKKSIDNQIKEQEV
jgi:hypothetical protein